MKLVKAYGNAELVKVHGNTELVKGPRKPKESKWAKDAQEKDKRDTGPHK